MTDDANKTSERVKRYQSLSFKLKELQDQLETTLGEMDSLWWSMTDVEQDIVDPAGKAFRAPHNANNKPQGESHAAEK